LLNSEYVKKSSPSNIYVLYLQITISTTENGYVVDIRFNRDCERIKGPEMFLNKTDVQLVRSLGLGPDEIIIMLEGASLQAKLATTDDFCSHYTTTFQIPMNGQYRYMQDILQLSFKNATTFVISCIVFLFRIKIIRLREEYMAVREVPEFPEMNYKVLLDENIDSQIGFYVPDLKCTIFRLL
jgi:hypothetical protein